MTLIQTMREIIMIVMNQPGVVTGEEENLLKVAENTTNLMMIRKMSEGARVERSPEGEEKIIPTTNLMKTPASIEGVVAVVVREETKAIRTMTTEASEEVGEVAMIRIENN